MPGARHVSTPFGTIWMSPIEAQLYDAMRLVELAPIPQFCVEGFFLDFAFPHVSLGVEADGSVHSASPTVERDHWRDMILRRSGWTILRFHGSTIFHGADRCAFVVRREVQNRIRLQLEATRMEDERRAARAEAARHPLRTLLRWLSGRIDLNRGPSSPPPGSP